MSRAAFFPANFATILLICGALLAGASSFAGPKLPPTFEPDSADDAAATLQGSTWLGSGETWAIFLKQVKDDERKSYVSSTVGIAADPFWTPPGKPPGYISFLLVVENRGLDELVINPMDSWLRTNRNVVKLPVGLAEMSFNYRVTGRELPPAYERIGPALLEVPRNLAPGESISGLLVYRSLHPKTRSFDVAVKLTLPDGEVVEFSAPYRRLKEKKQ